MIFDMWIMIPLLLIALLGWGCNQENERWRSPGSEIRAVRVPSFWIFSKPGERGLDVDLVRALSREMKLRVSWQTAPFSTIPLALQENKADIAVGGIVATPERERTLLFSDPYMPRRILLLENRGPQVVAVRRDSVLSQKAEETLPEGWKIQETESTGAALRLLETGQASRAWVEEEKAPRQGPWRVASRLPTGESYSIATNNEVLLAEINRALGNLEKSGQLDGIIKRWTAR